MMKSQQLQNENFDDEDFYGNLVFHGKVIEGYKVGKDGTIIGKQERPLTWSKHKYPAVKVRLPIVDFPFYADDQSGSSWTTGQMIPVHILVANAHIPFEDNLPEIWKSVTETGVPLWDLFSKEQKQEMRSLYQVDHIDGDKRNAHVSNLRYLPPVANTRAYHHGKSST